jgi:hypothetical protein
MTQQRTRQNTDKKAFNKAVSVASHLDRTPTDNNKAP